MAKATKNPTTRAKFEPRFTRGVLFALSCSPTNISAVPDPDGRDRLIADALDALQAPVVRNGCAGLLTDLLLAVDVLTDRERAALWAALDRDGFRLAYDVVVKQSRWP